MAASGAIAALFGFITTRPFGDFAKLCALNCGSGSAETRVPFFIGVGLWTPDAVKSIYSNRPLASAPGTPAISTHQWAGQSGKAHT